MTNQENTEDQISIPTPMEEEVAEDQISDELETTLKGQCRISLLNSDPWFKLGRMYERRRDWFRAEIAYQGGLYGGFDDADLVSRWLGVFAVNRDDKSRDAVLDSARRVEVGIKEHLAGPIDLVEKHLIFTLACLDDPKLATVCL